MLKGKYPTLSPKVVTFDYDDIADGTGTIIFYPFFARNAAEIYRMDNRVFKSDTIGTALAFGAKTTIMEKTFTTKAFNLPRTLKGTAYLKLPVAAYPKYSDNVLDIEPTITLYTYDGSTATQIVTISPLKYTTAEGIGFDGEMIIEIIVPETLIPLGWYVQMKVKVEMTRTAGTVTLDSAGGVGHDPEGETFSKTIGTQTVTVTDTQMILNLPFRIEV
jgi:hypothetical protein